MAWRKIEHKDKPPGNLKILQNRL